MNHYDDAVARIHELEDKLAAANALLVRALNKDPLVRRDIRTHLSGAEPAQTRTEADGDNLAAALACLRSWDPEARVLGNVRASTLLAVLTRTEAEQHKRGCICVRCEAEQAVLDTVGALTIIEGPDSGVMWFDDRFYAQHAACKAELARRGVKP